MKKIKRFLALSVIALTMTLPIFNTGSATSLQALEPAPETPKVYDEQTLVLHLFRNDENYAQAVDMWVWTYEPVGGEGVAHPFTHRDSYGVYLELPLVGTNIEGATKIGLINRNGGIWDNGQTADMIYDLSTAVFDENNAKHLYFVDLESTIFESIATALAGRLLGASFREQTEVRVKTNYEINNAVFKEDGVIISSAMGPSLKIPDEYAYETFITLDSAFVPDFKKSYSVEVTFVESGNVVEGNVSSAGLFDTKYFEDTLTYDGRDLGVTYGPTSSTFKVWAPTSDEIELRIYSSGTRAALDAQLGSDEFDAYPMTLGEKGVWSATVNGDLHGKYYTYFVKNYAFPLGIEATDPYAKAAGVNGDRSMIIDLATTNPDGWDQVELPTVKPTELVVYELHVDDLTRDETWTGTEANRGKFLGMIEEGTTYTEGDITVTTGFDHIKELGINALQILPFYDQANDEINMTFNWGYNPKNYNVVEGGYSSNPHDGAVRIKELKQVVQAYANEGIRIIMDVVYNHVASVSDNSLHKLVPEYYFRYQADGSLSNNSGVGNDTASERIMFRRFMVDSTEFWAKEYKLGGYRFDLMGLHDIETMNALAANINTFDDDFVIYGEPWDMYSPDGKLYPLNKARDMAIHANINNMPLVGGFNDNFRDGVKGNVFQSESVGWLQNYHGDAGAYLHVINGLQGRYTSTITNPNQIINYVDCHDNNTIHDKLAITAKLPGYERDDEGLSRQITQSAALTLTAQGVSFLHAGSEIFRSKPWDGTGEDGKETAGFDSNSYKSSYAVNSIKWDNKIKYYDEYEMYKALVNLKVNNPLFQLESATLINDQMSTKDIGADQGFEHRVIEVVYGVGGEEEIVAYHAGPISRYRLDVDGYEILFDNSGTYKPGDIGKGTMNLFANTTVIIKRKATTLPIDEPIIDEPIIDGPTKPKANTALIVSLSVGIPLIVAGAGVGVYFFVIKKKKN